MGAPPIVKTSCSSIIGVQTQSLGQAIGITGTPFSLYYNSNYSSGFKQNNTLDLPLTGSSLPNNIVGVDLGVGVAGRDYFFHFDATKNLRYTFQWDGKDCYGRDVPGVVPVNTSIGYEYALVRVAVPIWQLGMYTFSQMVGTAFTVPLPNFKINANTAVVPRNWQWTVGGYKAVTENLGGWTLDIHHRYDPEAKKIYYGNGEARDASAISSIIDFFLKPGSGDNTWISFAPDGALYFASYQSFQVWKRCPDGSIVVVAGTGSPGHSGDGGPATQAALGQVGGLALGPDGSLYISDQRYQCVRKVDPAGIITTYAGIAETYGSYTGDGGPAVNARLYYPAGLAVGPDGSLYIADEFNNAVRRVDPAGIITSVAGTGTNNYGYSGDGGPAALARLTQPSGVDVDKLGNIYIADAGNNRIRKITPDGIIKTIAGNGNFNLSDPNGDGGPAIQAEVYKPAWVTVGPDGSIYILQTYIQAGYPDNQRLLNIRKVSPEGTISTILSKSQLTANDTWYHILNSSAFGPDGNLYFADERYSQTGAWVASQGTVIHEVRSPFPGFSQTETSIASEDGSEAYVFDNHGRHLRTVDGLTGVRLYSFTYDSIGHLTAITDRDSLITTIQRDSSGTPLAFISPYGQRTLLNVDTTGCLASVIDPAGDTTRYGYTSDGLMTSLSDPKGNTHTFQYDSLGRLILDKDPAGGYKILTRTNETQGYSVTLTTALGNKSVYDVQRLTDGSQQMVNTDANGLADTTTYNMSDTWTTKSHDGTITQTLQGPDPRFGMMAPVTKKMTVTTPGKTTSITQESKVITQMNGTEIGQLADNVNVNGYTYQTLYNATKHLFTTTSPLGRKSFTFIDTLGKVTKDSIPGIVPVNYFYDTKGRLTSVAQGTRTSYFTYDSLGRISLAKDPIGHTSGFAYDSVGRVTTQVLPDGKVISFTYDANGNLITLAPPGRPEHIFDYNSNDLTTRYTPPQGVELPLNSDTTTVDTTNPEPRTTNYFYDLDKRLTTTNLPDGRSITITYDTAGCGCGGTADRIRSIGFDRGTQTFAYDAKGNLAQTVSPSGDTLLYGYDGSLPTSVAWKGAVKGNVSVKYDSSFRVTSQILNGVDTVKFKYENDGLLTNVGNMALSYNAQNGLLTGTTLGSVTTSQSYSSYGELSSYTANYNSSPIFQTTYSRDSLGRITTLNETELGVAKKSNYSYDAVGRLQNVWRNDTLVSQFVYDANGNRIAHITPSSIDSGTYDSQDRMLRYAGAQYFYGRNGDLQLKINGTDTTRYTYDAFGNLMQAVMPDGDLIQYVIDGQNRRIARKINGKITNKWLYAGQLAPIAELDSPNNVVARFSGSYLNKRDTIYQIITDHLGSPRLVVNVSTGAVVQRIDYDEFGNVVYDSNPGFQPFGFAGGLYDPETKLVRFGARDYDAETGRWTSKDPIGFLGALSNLFEYCLDDPLNFVDFFGLQFITPEEGQKIVNEAKTWTGTPYASPGSEKGVGADCSGATCGIYNNAGFPYTNTGSAGFPNDPHFKNVDNPQQGDVGWWKGHELIYDANAGEGLNAWTAFKPGKNYGAGNTSWWSGKPGNKGPVTWYRYYNQQEKSPCP